MKKRTILVVDDFIETRACICDMLNAKGYATFSTSNNFEAFVILLEGAQGIDLVLCNYNSCNRSNMDLLLKIKAHLSTKRTPVVFLTAEYSVEEIKKAKEAGLSTWIKKPYRAETFFAQIDHALLSEKKH